MAFKIKDGIPTKLKINAKVGSGGVTSGCLCVITGSALGITVVKAAAALSAGTLVGIATDTVLSGSYVDVELIGNHIITGSVTGSSKTSLVETDKLSTFDISDENTVNLDDNTGGSFVYVGNYDSTQSTADFMATEAAKFI
jgi:hypothetical protein